VNGDPLDNRRVNLRLATARQNNQGFRRKRAGATSQYRGVSWYARKQRWIGQIKVDGRGYTKECKTEYEAALWYNEKARQLFGEWAHLNTLPPSLKLVSPGFLAPIVSSSHVG
jgi:hypothetical protein